MSFPADIQGCMKDCILAILWPKEDVIRFFEKSGCTKTHLAAAKKFKEENLSRSRIVSLVFDELNRTADGGIGQFRAMLQSLLGWSHFDPYYFEKLGKLDRKEADRHLTHLRQLQEIRDAKIKSERAHAEQRESAAQTARKTIQEVKVEFLALFGAGDVKRRGYQLEGVLRELAKLSGLETTEPFRVNGEQIDGAIKYDGEHYVIEAKWQDKAAANEPVYQFASKVEGKLYGRGIFISINGFSENVPASLSVGKALKTIFVDGGDLVHVVEERITLGRLIDVKVKAAQTKGLIYVDALTGKSKA